MPAPAARPQIPIRPRWSAPSTSPPPLRPGRAAAAGLPKPSSRGRCSQRPSSAQCRPRPCGHGWRRSANATAILNGPQMPAAFGDLFQDRPAILIAHNAEYRTLEENAEAAGNAILRWLYRREARLSRAAEMRACAAAAFVFALTEEDRAALDEGGRKSAVLPLVARISPPAPPAERRIACDAALIGTWTWLPNRIGLEWFLGKVVPELPADFRTDIAGELPGGLSSGHRGVRFVGRVADAADFMRSGAVVALCSRAGTGVQVKTLATFELGLPAVATPHSIRGIE